MREAVIDSLNYKPFRPFRLVLIGGKVFDISDPDRVAVGKSRMHIFLPRSDRFATFKLKQVAAIEFNTLKR